VAPLGCTFSEVYTEAGAGELAFDIASPEFSALSTIGETLGIDIETDADPTKVLLIRRSADQILALERICPHTFCDMSAPLGTWDTQAEQLICLCHNSVFAADGAKISGPTPRGIAAYTVEFDPVSGLGVVKVGEPTDEMVASLTEPAP